LRVDRTVPAAIPGPDPRLCGACSISTAILVWSPAVKSQRRVANQKVGRLEQSRQRPGAKDFSFPGSANHGAALAAVSS
jgi:hypothetical protein